MLNRLLIVAGCFVSSVSVCAVELTGGWTFDGNPVSVPHCWNAVDGADGLGVPKNYGGHHSAMSPSYARGKHTYACALPAKRTDKRYFLECEGASIRAVVRVNGVETGRHEGAFTSFAFEVTDALKANDNRLEIDVDNTYDPNSLPVCADFTVYGGLYRAVRLIEKPRVCIDPRVPVRIDADPATGKATARYVLSLPEGAVAKTATRTFEKPELWCPENPRLYTFVLEDGEDRVEIPFGFRTAEFINGFFHLNGKKLFLHGVNRHQDREGKGWAISPEDEEDDIKTLKELGANVVRLSHYPQSRHLLDLCDKYGLLVWSEVPLVDVVTETEEFKTNCVRLATEMVNERYNHPAVVMWSAFNELYNFKDPPMKPGVAEPYAKLVYDTIKSLDATRPAVGASNQRPLKSLNLIPDAFGMNLYPGWYGSLEVDAYKGMVGRILQVYNANGKVPFAVSEYGAGASFGQHGDPLDRPERTWEQYHPLEYQAYLHWLNYKAIRESPYVWGSFVWCLFDFGADARCEGGRYGLNDKGLIGFDHKSRKDAYYFYQANWRTDLKVLHLVGRERQETDAPCTSVLAFSNVGDVTLTVNGKKIGTESPDIVKTVFWRNVPLKLGTNTIEISADGMTRVCKLVRKAVRPPVLAFPDRAFTITDFGAKSDGSLCTASIAQAIEACASAGGGRVVVPKGEWTTGGIRLKSGCDLHLEEGAKLVFTDNPQDYLPAVLTTWEGVECYNYSPLVYIAGCTNVAITGSGTLAPKMDTWRTWFEETPAMDAARAALYHWCSTNAPVEARNLLALKGTHVRPHLIQANRSKGILLDGFKIRESPFWMVHLYHSEDCTVRNLDAAAHGKNNDGVDIEMTRNVLVENCRFDQGDDGIVLKSGRNRDGWRLGRPTENVEVRNCTFKFAHSLVAAGSELSGGIRNVWLHDCKIGSSYNLLYIKTNRRRGGFVENILLENIDTDDVRWAMFALKTDILYQWANLPDYELRRTRIRDITVRNVHAKTADRAIDATGDPKLPPVGIKLENVTLDKPRLEFSRIENIDDLASRSLGAYERIDGIYPHLAMFNQEGECGTGAVVPWAGSLWVITYGPHCPTGSSDKLYEIKPDLTQIIHPESVGGTPANRLIHRESNQLLIGPYVIDANGKVRVVSAKDMPGRLTGAARHLADPANKIYVATMETGLYELDLRSLAVNTLIRENGKNDWEYGDLMKKAGRWPDGWETAPVTRVLGYHAKGLCSGFGRVFVANNGEDSEAARTNPFVPSGVLADWSEPGKDWRTIRRCQFTEVTTRDGIYGNEHPGANPIWSLGWDAKSVILAVTTNGVAWSYYRLPKASHCYDGAHGWNTEWPRIREANLGGGDLLATMHGTFWRFPKDFSPSKPNGIRPISTYLKVIGDFCWWQDAPGGGSIVFGCDDQAQNEFLGKRTLKKDAPKRDRSQSNLWFVKPENLPTFGPPSGEGWVWLDEDVKAGAVSEPYLWEGYAERAFAFVDAAGREVPHELIREGDWVRVKALADATGAKAHFRYGPKRPATLPEVKGVVEVYDDYSKKTYRFPNVNGDKTVICREVATERDLLYVGGVFYELPADNAGGFEALRPIALATEPVKSIEAKLGLVYINGKAMTIDSLWKNGTAAQAYWLWTNNRH